MPKLSLGIFKRISNNVYHYLTLNVRIRTKNNIPHINFVSEFGKATAVRGGRRKKIYTITKPGFESLKEYKRISDLLWENCLKYSSPQGSLQQS